MNLGAKNGSHKMGDQQEKKRGFLSRSRSTAPESAADGGQPPSPDILSQLAREPVSTAADYNAIAHLKQRLMEVHEETDPAAAELPSWPVSEPEPSADAAVETDAAYASDKDGTEQEGKPFLSEPFQGNHDGQAGENVMEEPVIPIKLTPEEIKLILNRSAKHSDDNLSLLELAAESSAEKNPPPPEAEPIRHAPPVHKEPPPDDSIDSLSGGDDLDALIQQLSDASQLPAKSLSSYDDAYDFMLPDLGEPVSYQEESLHNPPTLADERMTPEPDAPVEGIEEPDASREESGHADALREASEPAAPDCPVPEETTPVDILLQEAGYSLLGEYALLHQIAVAETTMVDFLLNNAYANNMLVVENAVFLDAVSAQTLLADADGLAQSGRMEEAVSLTVQICVVCADSELTMNAYHLLRRLCQMTGDEETPKAILEQMLLKERQILDMLRAC